MAKSNKGIMKHALENMLRDLKTIYTDAWFLPKDSFASAVDAWYRALGTFSNDQLRAAFDRYVEKSNRPPTPSQIRELIFQAEDSTVRNQGFDEETYFREHVYWVLLDLNGYHINDIIADAGTSVDEIREFFTTRGYPAEGTVLKPVDYKTYRPRYIPRPNQEDLI